MNDDIKYIDSQAALEEFAKRAKKSKVLAIDTEFLREKTYFPNLCLLQIATDREVVLIDPFEIDGLEPLRPLLLNEGIMKIFHAGSQDIEIILNELDIVPKPVFDVQIAGSMLGQTYQAGLSSLLQHFLGINIKKGDSFTDWTQRPLTESQIKYASEDVIYLPKLYATMKRELKEKGRLSWMDDESRRLTDPKTYIVDPYDRYKHLKRGNQLNRRQMAAARAVAAWREKEAIKRDVPRKWVLSDEQIVEACRREAGTIDELFMVRGLKKSLPLRDARRISSLIKEALSSDEATWPRPETHSTSEENVDSALDLMQAVCRVRSKESGIAMQVIASNSELVSFARRYTEDSKLMRGWRKELVGNDLLDLLNGRIDLRLKDGNLVIKNRKRKNSGRKA